jgi:hypothetical protein
MLVASGMTSKQIARELGLAPSTVDSHVRSAMARLGATNRISAAKLFSTAPHIQVPAPETFTVETGNRSANSWLPPLGGHENRLSMNRRVVHIVQIALLGIAGMAASVVTIAGLVNLFGS